MHLKCQLQNTVMTFTFSLAAEIEGTLISIRIKKALAKVKSDERQLGRPKSYLSKSKLDGKEISNWEYLLTLYVSS